MSESEKLFFPQLLLTIRQLKHFGFIDKSHFRFFPPYLIDHGHAQVALGMPGFPLWLYHLAECFCHLGLAASVFLTIAITIERYQVRIMMMVVLFGTIC